MTVDVEGGGPPPTRGPDAVDYRAFSHVLVDGELLVYATDGEDAWVQSDRFVDLDERR